MENRCLPTWLGSRRFEIVRSKPRLLIARLSFLHHAYASMRIRLAAGRFSAPPHSLRDRFRSSDRCHLPDRRGTLFGGPSRSLPIAGIARAGQDAINTRARSLFHGNCVS